MVAGVTSSIYILCPSSSVQPWKFHPFPLTITGGFLEWGYPQSSSMLVSFSITKTIHILGIHILGISGSPKYVIHMVHWTVGWPNVLVIACCSTVFGSASRHLSTWRCGIWQFGAKIKSRKLIRSIRSEFFLHGPMNLVSATPRCLLHTPGASFLHGLPVYRDPIRG